MIQEIIIFSMGFLFATLVKQWKIISITMSMKKELKENIAEAEKMQEEFNRDGSSRKMVDRQIKSMSSLERHISAKKILKKFNYIIW